MENQLGIARVFQLVYRVMEVLLQLVVHKMMKMERIQDMYEFMKI